MTTTTFPNGQILASTALTVAQMNVVIQAWTLQVLGMSPTNFSRVRVNWPTQGQPFSSLPSEDVCYVQSVTHDTDYARIRDKFLSGTGPVTETWSYTRGWQVAWCTYGPNAADNLRLVKSALFLEYFNTVLNASNLYPLPDPPEPTYAPENIDAEWWARSDFHVDLYEAITETLTTPTGGYAKSVEVKVYDESPADPVADFTVTKS